jgi:hypothetical protein
MDLNPSLAADSGVLQERALSKAFPNRGKVFVRKLNPSDRIL